MRLLNTKDYTLSSFIGPIDTPPYAILSHTWGPADEVLFEDMVKPELFRTVKTRKPISWQKVERSCEIARTFAGRRYNYIWIDTLCIDKSSSTELSEAINSMFEWYACAGVCFAYLADYDNPIGHNLDPGSDTENNNFTKSRWFARGWTLQELIAPEELLFFDQHWGVIGNRRNLADPIRARTGIYRAILARQQSGYQLDLRELLSAVSVAVKMSWLSQRITTRPEDRAYCMLGLFDVNIPLLYGEGSYKSFIRLQEEIIKNSFDQSILAWEKCSETVTPTSQGRWHSVLAPDPGSFARCRGIQPLRAGGHVHVENTSSRSDGTITFAALLRPLNPPYQVIEDNYLFERPRHARDRMGYFETASSKTGLPLAYLAILNCCEDGNFTKRVALMLYRDSKQSDRFYRAHAGFFIVTPGQMSVGPWSSGTHFFLDHSRASPAQITLCSLPKPTYHAKYGYWPCAYDWKLEGSAQGSDWTLVDLLEAKHGLEPSLPIWLATKLEPPGLFLTNNGPLPNHDNISGVMLFTHRRDSAFFVIWGLSSGYRPAEFDQTMPWWKSPTHKYFGLPVEWERLMARPHSRAALDELMGKWHDDTESNFFNDHLLSFCRQELIGHDLPNGSRTTIRFGNGTSVDVTTLVAETSFLDIEGLEVKVVIE